ncbi:MAG: DnaJ domain-containing protein [Syntrophobacterales bacterium]|nr:MAG: DnaJ domain-containing protein [Syntrophobacterales bacterium]
MKAWLWRTLPLILVLLYIASPLDLIPEFLVGPAGLMEDLFLIGALVWFLTARRAGESPGDFYRRYRGYKRPSPGQRENSYEEKRDGRPPRDREEGDPFRILGVEPGASPDEIKAAYRRAVAKYHPDKVTHLGKEFQELAHRKLLAIQRAYKALMNT